jgi:hypothetical protein
MTRTARLALLIVLVLAGPAAALADVVVLKGGSVIKLKSAPVVRGNNVVLTRADGTVLLVPVSEIDRAATATARAAVPAPPAPTPATPATLAEAARAAKEVPKARVRITDADVAHGETGASGSESAAVEGGGAAVDASAGAGRVEVADYTQEKSGDALIVRGSLKNPGATPASNVRMTVTANDSKGQAIVSGEAGASGGTIAPGGTVAFTVSLTVGTRAVGSIRFTPRWVSEAPAGAPVPDASTSRAGGASAAGAPAAGTSGAAPGSPGAAPGSAAPVPRPNAPPQPGPTPYGQGMMYAAPAPNAPSTAPADGKTGYLPGASHPANQPKPPN